MMPFAETENQLACHDIGLSLGLLDSFNDFTIVLNTIENTVIRCSSCFKEHFFDAEKMTIKEFCKRFSGMHQEYFDIPIKTACRLDYFDKEGCHKKNNISVFFEEHDKTYDFSMISLQSGLVVIYLSKDISESSEVQRYLEDREQLFSTSRTISVNEMATTLAHEINQPIGTIANILQGMRMRMERLENPQQDFLVAIDKMISQTTFAANIISRIRDFTHSRRPENEAIDLVVLLESSVALLDWEISKNQIALNIDCDKDIYKLHINGDRTMLQQVFVNLLRNSIEAIRDNDSEKRTMQISVFLNIANVEVQLSDTGGGLTNEAKDNLFLPFVSSKSTGMGVGLNICRSFIELHQGKLWLSSNVENPSNRSEYNTGCTAHVVLPLISADATHGS